MLSLVVGAAWHVLSSHQEATAMRLRRDEYNLTDCDTGRAESVMAKILPFSIPNRGILNTDASGEPKCSDGLILCHS